MKTFLLTALAGASLVAAALPAAAQPMGPPMGDRAPISQRLDRINERIDTGLRDHSLTRREASRLRAETRQIERLEVRYRRDGLNPRERADLERRLDGLRAQIHMERRG